MDSSSVNEAPLLQVLSLLLIEVCESTLFSLAYCDNELVLFLAPAALYTMMSLNLMIGPMKED